MRVFVTGGTGYIGTAVVDHLLRAGHQVTGLARSEAAERRLRALGAKSIPGDMRQAAAYGMLAAEHEAIIHLAMDHGPGAADGDRAAVSGLLDTVLSSPRCRMLVYTSGVMVLGNTGDHPVGEEASTRGAPAAVCWRPGLEKLVLEEATSSVATAVIRPGLVYGGWRGLISEFFRQALQEGAAVYLGDGENRWPLIQVDDLARLYLLVLERHARGIFHGVDGAAVRVKEVARAASEAAGRRGATRSWPLEEARAELGPLADVLCLDQVVRAPRALELGWAPSWPPFPESARRAFKEWQR